MRHEISDSNCRFSELYDVTANQDLVTRGGKFFKLFKRPRHRVLIDKSGAMLVHFAAPHSPFKHALLYIL